MKKKLLVAGCWLLVLSVNNLQSMGQTIDKDRLSVSISKLAEKYNIPDYSVAFIRNDSLLFTLDKNSENEGKNFLIGSCSKSLTALAVLRLAEEGKIDIDRPVRSYLPWFEMKNGKFTDSITIRRLLNHKSGFERQHGFYDPRTDDKKTYEQKLADYIRSLNVRFAPGTYFLYSNLNYVILGLVVSNVTGLTYSRYLSTGILPAARMPDTRLTFSENNTHNLIQPYHYLICGVPFRSKRYNYSDFMVPAGYISSNAADLASYLRLLLRGTITSNGDTLLSETYFDALTGGNQTGYAMGWFNSVYKSVRVIRHTGLDENFASSLNFYPGMKVGWAVLCNVNSLEFCDRVDQVIDSRLRGLPDPRFRSSEIPMRWLAFFLPILVLAGLVFNLLRWRRYGFSTGIVTMFLPGLRLIAGIFLSVIGLIFISKAFQMNIIDGVRFSPDLMWGLILIAVFGIASSFARYFGSYSKFSK